MSSKLRAILAGIGSLVDLDGRTTRERANRVWPQSELNEALARHAADVCPHGVQFLDECEQCPNGWEPRGERDDEPEETR